MPSAFRLAELKTDADFSRMWPLIQQLNPGMKKTVFTRRLKDMRTRGYRCVAAIEGRDFLGLAGFWIGTRLWCGKYVDVDNVIVSESARGKGVGRALMRWIEKEAIRQGCELSVLDSYTTYHDAHRFYFREGYIVLGYHFVKRLDGQSAGTLQPGLAGRITKKSGKASAA